MSRSPFSRESVQEKSWNRESERARERERESERESERERERESERVRWRMAGPGEREKKTQRNLS
jgi:hypothetical protein